MPKLKHNYHDGTLCEVRFSGTDITLVVDLDGYWNNQCAERAYLFFYDVKNFDEIRETLAAIGEAAQCGSPDEIIGIIKVGADEYLVDLARVGSIVIKCRSLSEV